jgi:hypothetical protein
LFGALWARDWIKTFQAPLHGMKIPTTAVKETVLARIKILIDKIMRHSYFEKAMITQSGIIFTAH